MGQRQNALLDQATRCRPSTFKTRVCRAPEARHRPSRLHAKSIERPHSSSLVQVANCMRKPFEGNLLPIRGEREHGIRDYHSGPQLAERRFLADRGCVPHTPHRFCDPVRRGLVRGDAGRVPARLAVSRSSCCYTPGSTSCDDPGAPVAMGHSRYRL